MSLPSFRTSRYQTAGAALAVAAMAALGFLPLFGGPSYEFALACGIVVPLICAVSNVLEILTHSPTPEAAYQRGVSSGLVFSVCAVSIGFAHGFRAGFCDPWSQMPLFLLGPIPGIVCGGVWGALCAVAMQAVQGNKRFALGVGLAVAGPVLSIAASFWRYYTSPIIFAFDHFVGFFAGTLYDTEIGGTVRLLTYRVGTLGFLLLAYGATRILVREAGGRLKLIARARPGSAALGLSGLVLGTAITASGPQLGHYQTAKTIRTALGHAADSKRCEVVYAAGIPRRDAHALARDCDAHIAQHEAFFETRGPEKTTVFLFSSADQKSYLMGARDVYIAKPWRNEVYIQQQSYPHSVLGHELAHVVAGSFGQGPFKIAGPFGGWVPDPGRIEGVAVAAAPREDDDLTLLEWNRAMKDLKLLPPLSAVFELSFLGENSSKAYTVAGAFVQWLHGTYGATAVKAWYGGATLLKSTGQDLPELEQTFLESLDAVHVSAAAMSVAKARFDRPAIFGRRCPHEVDELAAAAGAALSTHDPIKAEQLYQDVLKLDPDHYAARLGLGDCSLRQGELAQAQERYQRLASDKRMTSLARAYANERIGNAHFSAGEIAKAKEYYSKVADAVVDEHHLRALDVKQLVQPNMAEKDPVRSSVEALLIGDPSFGTDWGLTGFQLGRWSETAPTDGTPEYLLGKNLVNMGRWREGAQLLDNALAKRLALPRVRSEALRTRVFAGCALGQKQAAQQALDDYLRQDGVAVARLMGVRKFARRCGLGVQESQKRGSP